MELLTRHCHFIFRKHLPANAFSMAAAEGENRPMVCSDGLEKSLPSIMEAADPESTSCDMTAPARIEAEVSCQPLTPQDRSLLASIQGSENEETKAYEPSAMSQGSDSLASIRSFEKEALKTPETCKPLAMTQGSDLLASIRGFQKGALKTRETCKVASQGSNLLASIRGFDKGTLKARETCKPIATSQRSALLASIRGFEKGAFKARQTCEPPVASQDSNPLASIRGFEDKNSITLETQERCEPTSTTGEPCNSATRRNSNIKVQSKLQATVLHNFEAQDDDELPLCCGATVTVLERGDDGWWRGCLANGDVGLFPGNHVTLVA